MIWILAIASAAWIGALTLAVLAIARQVSAILLLLEQRPQGSFSVDADGPPIGLALPVSFQPSFAHCGLDISSSVLLLAVSATCGPCRDVVVGFDPSNLELNDPSPVLLIAGEGPSVDELRSLAGSKFTSILSGPDIASMVQNGLSIHSSPFGILVRDGLVQAKCYVRDIDDFYGLVHSGEFEQRPGREEGLVQ